MLAPCNYVGKSGDLIAPECITDPEQQFEYLGDYFSIEILHNTERMDL